MFLHKNNELPIKKHIWDMVPASLWYILMFSGIILGWKPLSGDNFYQIAIGKIIIDQGIPHEIPLTVHTAEHLHYMAQQWLFMVVDYELFSHFGWISLLVLGVILDMAVVYAAYRMFLHVGDGRRIIAYPYAFFLSFFPLLMGGTGQFLRPYFVTCVLLILEVLILENFRKESPAKKGFILFPLLSILSINLHSAMWPMLFVMLLPYYAESMAEAFGILKKRIESYHAIPLKRLAYVSLLILLFGLLNPYGTEAITYGLRSYGIPILREQSSEMMTLFYVRPVYAVIVIGIMATNLWLWKRFYVPLSYVLLSLGTGFMALLSFRSLLLFFLFAMLPVIYCSRTWRPIGIRKKWGPVLVMLCVSMPVYFFEIMYPDILGGPILKHYARSEAIIREDAEELGITPGPVFSPEFESNYFMIHEIPVYYFTSDESFTRQMNQKFDVLREFLDVRKGRISLAVFDKKYGFHYYYVYKESLIGVALRNEPGFTLIYDSAIDPDSYMSPDGYAMCIYRGPSAQRF